MSLIEQCAREAALELSSFEIYDEALVAKIILKHFEPVAEAMEKARSAIGDPYASAGDVLAALDGGK